MRHHVRHGKNLSFLINILMLFFFLITHVSCVSVKLGNEDVTKSGSVHYNKPAAPFENITLKNADHAWQNKQTGSTLSYLSICNDTSDPTLESLRNSTLRGIEVTKIDKEDTIPFNSREALKSDVLGQLDGVKVIVKLLIFKKNFCSYTISMVSIQGKSLTDSQEFERFIQGFTAP